MRKYLEKTKTPFLIEKRNLHLEGHFCILQEIQIVACDAFEQLFVIEHLYEAVDHGKARFIGDRDREVDVIPHIRFDSGKKSAAASKDDAAVVDIRGDLRAEFC